MVECELGSFDKYEMLVGYDESNVEISQDSKLVFIAHCGELTMAQSHYIDYITVDPNCMHW